MARVKACFDPFPMLTYNFSIFHKSGNFSNVFFPSALQIIMKTPEKSINSNNVNMDCTLYTVVCCYTYTYILKCPKLKFVACSSWSPAMNE